MQHYLINRPSPRARRAPTSSVRRFPPRNAADRLKTPPRYRIGAANPARWFTYLLVLLAITGCERSRYDGEGGGRAPADALIYMIGPPDFDPRWPAMRNAAANFVSETPPLRIATATPTDTSSAALNVVVRKVIGRNPHAVCLFVSDPEHVADAVKLLADSPAILVTFGRETPFAAVYGHVDVNWPSAAEALGANLTTLAAGKRSFVLVHERDRSESGRRLYDRFRALADQHYGLTLLAEASRVDGGRSASELVGDLQRQFPYAGLVVTLTPEPWLDLAAPPALAPGQRFATVGIVPQLWPALLDGRAAGLAGPSDGEIGRAAAALAVSGLTQSEGSGVMRVVLSELVTRENLDEFRRAYFMTGEEAEDAGRSEPAPAGP